jgi:predicted DNA-binding ribbon-helix-helix protein
VQAVPILSSRRPSPNCATIAPAHPLPHRHRLARNPQLSSLRKRSFSLAGHRTSVALEPEFWTVLLRIARSRGQTLSALVAAADEARDAARPLASVLRVMALTEAASPLLTHEPESS